MKHSSAIARGHISNPRVELVSCIPLCMTLRFGRNKLIHFPQMNKERQTPFHHKGQNEYGVPREKNSGEQPVLVNGRYLGREVQTFVLAHFGAIDLGSDAYKEVFFETTSGNIYHAYPIGHANVAIVDGNSNKGRGGDLRGTVLLPADLKHATLNVGRSFAFGSGSSTSEIVRITALTGKQFITTEPDEETVRLIAKRETNGKVSDVKKRFESIVKSS